LEVTKNSTAFADEEEISDYAKTAVETMQSSGHYCQQRKL